LIPMQRSGCEAARRRIARVMCAVLMCGAALLSSAGSGTARAQEYEDPPQRKALALKLGLYVPSNDDARAAGVGDRILSLEADYVVQHLIESNSVSVASVGYISKDALRIMPVTISQVFRQPGTNYYYGAGIGLYSVRLSLPDTDGSVKNMFGGFGVVGMDLGQSLLAEIKYHYLNKYDNKFLGGLLFQIGGRF
jgi:hypothetical protein